VRASTLPGAPLAVAALVAAALLAAPGGSPGTRTAAGPAFVLPPPPSRGVAITFDDGPGPRTREIVARLRAAGARATFFQLGLYVEREPSLARLAATAGELGNHGWAHRELSRLSRAEVRADVVRTQRAIERATGTSPTVFRAPYGSRSARLDAIVRELGLDEVLWTIDTRDWEDGSVGSIVWQLERGLRPGAIILFHEHGRSTVAALEWLLAELDRRGLAAVTVSELLGRTTLTVMPRR
jgi:peptidoglycan/xylan/chitin deacetylase (PgdA/CDA1 family)